MRVVIGGTPNHRRPRSSLQVTDSADGAIVPIRAIPRAGRSAIAGLRDGMLLVRLQSAPAPMARANAEFAVTCLSDALRVPQRDLRSIVSGQSARTKRIHDRLTAAPRCANASRPSSIARHH